MHLKAATVEILLLQLPSPLSLPLSPFPSTPPPASHPLSLLPLPPPTPSQESHLKEIGINIVGDRIVFMEYLKLLKKHKRDADRSKALWNGTTPVLSLAYHHNCGEFCFHVSV